jgi:hypothetical protein
MWLTNASNTVSKEESAEQNDLPEGALAKQ